MSDPTLPAPTGPGGSYWVIPEELLAGPYPGEVSEDEAIGKLAEFLDAGITYFVDLTEEGEGPPLKPYSGLLQQVAEQRNERVIHRRFPIRDVSVPTPSQMREILDTIRGAIDDSETVYVHCRGGVGRTGTVVGCLLVEEGRPPDEVLGQLARMRARTTGAPLTSPETSEQRAFVLRWHGDDELALEDPPNLGDDR